MKIQTTLTAFVAASSFVQAMHFPVHSLRDVAGPGHGDNHPPSTHLADGHSEAAHLNDDNDHNAIDRNGDGDTTPEHLEDNDDREASIDRNGDGNNLPDHLEADNTANTNSQAGQQQGSLAAVDNDRNGDGINNGDDVRDGDRDGDGDGPDGIRNAAGVNAFPMLGGIAGVAVAMLVAL